MPSSVRIVMEAGARHLVAAVPVCSVARVARLQAKSSRCSDEMNVSDVDHY